MRSFGYDSNLIYCIAIINRHRSSILSDRPNFLGARSAVSKLTELPIAVRNLACDGFRTLSSSFSHKVCVGGHMAGAICRFKEFCSNAFQTVRRFCSELGDILF